MRFFVPTANDPAHARMLYNRIRDGAVGDRYHAFGGEPVLAIFKAPPYFVVCTARHDADHREPIQIEQDAVTVVENFG